MPDEPGQANTDTDLYPPFTSKTQFLAAWLDDMHKPDFRQEMLYRFSNTDTSAWADSEAARRGGSMIRPRPASAMVQRAMRPHPAILSPVPRPARPPVSRPLRPSFVMPTDSGTRTGLGLRS